MDYTSHRRQGKFWRILRDIERWYPIGNDLGEGIHCQALYASEQTGLSYRTCKYGLDIAFEMRHNYISGKALDLVIPDPYEKGRYLQAYQSITINNLTI